MVGLPGTWHQHGIQLHNHNVTVVAQDTSQAGLFDFGQLGRSEGGVEVSILIPESIAFFDPSELFSDNAGKGWTDHRAWQGLLRGSRNEQIDIFNVSIQLTHHIGHLWIREDILQAGKRGNRT